MEVLHIEKVKVSDYEAVVSVISKYAQGCKEGKSEIMKPAFHKDAIIYGYLNGELNEGSIENLYSSVDQLGADKNTKVHIDVLSVEGTAATVRVVLEDWHGLAFTDFHSLLKVDGKWQIIAKLFHQY